LKPICFSGGAKGADHAWGLMAVDAGHELIHFTFQGYRPVEDTYAKQLSTAELNEANPYVETAARSMKRRWPSQNPVVNNLLRRNHFQVRYSERVYAVANLLPDDKGALKISGGTCWAAQMFVDRWYADRTLKECELYFYDMISNQWMQWWETWKIIDKPPVPHGRYAGIGSRDITNAGIKAIFSIYG
jgi:hypothetical protein